MIQKTSCNIISISIVLYSKLLKIGSKMYGSGNGLDIEFNYSMRKRWGTNNVPYSVLEDTAPPSYLLCLSSALTECLHN